MGKAFSEFFDRKKIWLSYDVSGLNLTEPVFIISDMPVRSVLYLLLSSALNNKVLALSSECSFVLGP